MPGFKLVFLNPLPHSSYCGLCKLPMRRPVRISTCRHRFCDYCLQQHLGSLAQKCPEDDELVDFADVYPDQDLEDTIMNSTVRCNQSARGCNWIGKLADLERHIPACYYTLTRCPRSCKKRIMRCDLNDHLQQCPNRVVQCEFCAQDFTSQEYDDVHSGTCYAEVVWCENKCGIRLRRSLLDHHMTNICRKRTVLCPYCSHQFVEETLQTHISQCPHVPYSHMNTSQCDVMSNDKSIIVASKDSSAHVSCPYTEAGCTFRGPKSEIERHLEANTKPHLEIMWTLVAKQQKQIDCLSSALNTVSNVTNGTFVWRVNDHHSQFIKAQTSSLKQEIISQPFYTCHHGYKMAISLFLNGNASGEGSHLSVYLKLLPGEYDSILSWPFTLPVSITLFDQTSDPDKRVNITRSFQPDPSWRHFQRPLTMHDSMGFGYPCFILLDNLKTRHYLRDNSLMFKVKVDNTNFCVP